MKKFNYVPGELDRLTFRTAIELMEIAESDTEDLSFLDKYDLEIVKELRAE